jgi:hypothetical protein
VCEGLFFEQAGAKAGLVADYLVSVLRRKIAAGLPAFLYGHPERRLGKFPAIVERLGAAVAAESLVWKTTLTEYARWWIRRAAIQFSVTRRADGVLCVEFKPNPTRDRVCLEIEQPDGTATIPVEDRILLIPSQEIEYRASTHRFDQPHGSSVRGPWGMKAPLRRWLDWETVTPREELAADSPGRWLKKCLRGLHDLQRESA